MTAPPTSSATPRICCIGDLVTDVVVHLGSDPKRGTDTPATISSHRGGSAANVAAAVSAAGGIARFAGCVGTDSPGDALVANLEANHVESMVQRTGTTGTIVVLVDGDGERSFLSDRGAATELASVPSDFLDGVDLLHIPAYSFIDGPLAETSEHVVGIAVDAGVPISISTSSVAALAQYGREEFRELLSAIRPAYVIANHDEFTYLMQGQPWVRGAGATVITNGPRAAVVRQTNGTEVRSTPAASSATDTTGAGDAFTAGFLVARAKGQDFASALAFGHAVAAKALSARGAELAS